MFLVVQMYRKMEVYFTEKEERSRESTETEQKNNEIQKYHKSIKAKI